MPLIDRNKNFENRQKSLNILKIWNFKKKPKNNQIMAVKKFESGAFLVGW